MRNVNGWVIGELILQRIGRGNLAPTGPLSRLIVLGAVYHETNIAT